MLIIVQISSVLHTYLRDYSGFIDVFAIAPPINTPLLLQVSKINILAWNISLSWKIFDHIQPVSPTSAQLQLPIHHLAGK